MKFGFILALCCLGTLAYAQPQAGDPYTHLYNAERVSQHCFKITNNLGNQFGAVWFNSQLNLAQPFSLDFNIYMGGDNNGADGIAFVMHRDPRGINAIGEFGGGLGFGNHPSQPGTNFINNSVAIEFDTYANGDCTPDPAFDHTTVVYNGNVCTPRFQAVRLKPASVFGLIDDIEDNRCYTFRITWDPATRMLRLFNGTTQVFAHQDNIVDNVFGGQTLVSYGFTGSTGGQRNEQTVCIMGTNTEPIAQNDAATTPANRPVTVDVLANDTDADGDQLSVTDIVQQPANGTASITSDGKVLYTARAGFTGQDVLQYRVCDARDDACYANCKVATVTITVTPPVTEPLVLTSVCAPFPASQRRWQIANPNTRNLEVRYQVVATGQTGILTAAASGNTFFFTPAITDPQNAVTIYWKDQNNQEQSITTVSSTASCTCALAVSVTPINATCYAADGAAILSASGGSGNFTYQWSDGTQTKDLVNVIPGTYTVEVSDVINGCGGAGVVTITAPTNCGGNNYSIDVDKTDITCNGVKNGSAEVNITGEFQTHCETPPAPVVSCNSGCTREVRNNESFTVSAGQQVCLLTANYSGRIMMAGGTLVICGSVASSAEIVFAGIQGGQVYVRGTASLNNFNLALNSTLTNYGTVAFTSGTTVARNLINHGTMTVNGDLNLNAGTLYNTGTMVVNGRLNSNGTTTNSGSLTIRSDLQLNGGGQFRNNCILNIDREMITNGNTTFEQAGKVNVGIRVRLNGNGRLLTYPNSEITTPYIGGSGNVIGQGSYCSSIKVTTAITNMPPVSGPVKICRNNNAGCLCDITQPPCTYLWSNGATTPTVQNLAPGTYTVKVSCGSNVVTKTVVIQEPPALTTQAVTVQNVQCHGQNNGTINLAIGGGTAPYNIEWSNGAVSEDLSNLAPGSYIVKVTDAKGCIKSDTFAISQPDSLVVQATVNGPEASVQVTGGTAPYTYQWSDGFTGANQNNLKNGIYTVVVTDANGCTTTVQLEVTDGIDKCDHFSVSLQTTDITCHGLANGLASVVVNDGNPPYQFLWSTGSDSTSVRNLAPGSYSVTIKDRKNCGDTLTFTIREPLKLSVSLKGTNVSCFDLKNGKIDATIEGGTSPYTFQWSNGAATEDLENLSPGTYSLVVTDSLGCTVTSDDVTITQPDALAISLVDIDVSCKNAVNGSIVATITGGTAPFTYLWSNGATTKDVSALSPGDYTLTVTDTLGCTLTSQVAVITEPDALSISLADTDVTCKGGANGSIVATIAGGTAPFTYLWSNGAITKDVSALAPGSYSLTVTDSLNCTLTSQLIAITEPDVLTVSLADTDVSCNDAANGSIVATITGGTVPFTYLWSNGATTKDISALLPGDYTLTVTDSLNCTATSAPVTITQPDVLAVSTTPTQITCNGAGDGVIILGVSGGTAPFTYLWSNGATTRDITNLQPGTYSVAITDAKGCTVTSEPVTITQPEVLAVVTTPTQVTCNGADNGVIMLGVSGGTAPFTYLWSNGATTKDIANLQPGTYSVAITDAKGCTVTSAPVTITQPDVLAVVTTPTQITCNGAGDGVIILGISGGTAPFAYLWSNGATTKDITNLQPGAYSVTVTDANGCSVTSSAVTITQPDVLAVATAPTQVDCNGFGNGSIASTVSGGTAPFTYLWSSGAITKDIVNLQPGTYSVTVTDARGCTITSPPVIITQPDILAIPITPTQITCNGAGNGSITSAVSGGTAPFTYLWSNGATTKDIVNLQPGTYSVGVTDAKGCTITSAPVTITQPDVLAVAITPTQITCNGAGNGSITSALSGGTAPFTYLWSNGATTKDIANLHPGAYSVSVTDAKGCTVTSAPVTIIQPDVLVVATSATQITCNGAGNGSVTSTVTGGTAPFTYLWSNGATTKDISGLQSGTYSVTVTDARGCTVTSAPATIETQPAVLAVTTSPTQITCNGAGNGIIASTVSGGTAPFTYLWTNGATTKDISGLQSGTYSVTITDARGCTVTSAPATIDPQPAVLAVTTSPVQITCNGAGNGSVTSTVSGGTAPFTYLWTNGATTKDLTNLQSGTYSVTVTDARGCTVTSTPATIETQPGVLAVTTSATQITCNGAGNGSVTSNVTGGTAPFTYLWTNGATTKDLANLQSGTYSVTVTDARGCTVTSTPATIETQPGVLAVTTAVTQITCNGAGNGSVTSTVTGGTAPFTYLWTNGATTKDITGLQSGTYSVTVTDARGCTVTSTPATIETQPGVLAVTTAVTQITCNGAGNGSVTSTVTGGTAPFTYLWTNGATTKDITGLQSGTYSVTVTDARGCTITSTPATIETQPAVLTVTTSTTQITCNGAGNGSVTSTVTGGTAPFTYLWTNGATTKDITGLQSGTYSVTVTDARGCTITSTPATIETQPAVLTVTTSTTQITCNGAGNGSVTSTVTGGTAPFTYLWTNGATTEDISGLQSGTYSVTVTDARGCTVTSTPTTIETQPGVLAVTTSAIQITCNGAGNGSVTSTVTGGTAPFTYLWTNGATTKDLANLQSGTYSVTVTDARGCTVTSTPATIETQPGVLAVTTSATQITCNGAGNGSVTSTVTGGTAPFTYLWTNGATTKDITGLQSGTYSVTVTDARGCTVTSPAPAAIDPQPAVLTVSTAATQITCNGAGNGSVTSTVAGGTAPYTYLWTNGATTKDLANLQPGTYSVTVTDARGCTVTSPSPVTIDPQPAVLTVSTVATQITCNGAGNGSVASTVAGGTAPYTYLWTNGAATKDLANLQPGTYSVTVTDARGCTVTSAPAMIETQPNVLAVTTSATQITCNGAGNGSVTSIVTGGTAPFTYLWTNGATTKDITGLQSGTYSVTVTDARGCIVTSTPVTIGESGTLTVSIIPTDITCNGAGNGSITSTVLGGTEPFTYRWSNNATTKDITGLQPGTYSVTVTDANACTATSPNVPITQPASLNVSLTPVSVSCGNPASGAVTTSVAGGTAPFTYLWSNGATTANLTNVGAGQYSVTITDAHSCTATGNTTVPQAGATFTISLNQTRTLSCNDATDAAISAQVQGGASPFQYRWNNNATTASLDNIGAGEYTLTVTDASGCTNTATIEIERPGIPCGNACVLLSFTPSAVSCAGARDGAIVLNVVGGSGDYNYRWNTGATTKNLSGLQARTYSVTVTDKANSTCVRTGSVTVPDVAPMEVDITGDRSTICGTGDVLTITAEGSEGAYLWSTGETTQSITVITPGSYWVRVTRGACSITSMPAIISRAPDAIQVISSALAVCPGKTITLTSPFNSGNTWLPGGATSRSIDVGSGGTYTLKVAFEDCQTLEASITITQKTVAECEMKVDPLCDPTPFPEIEVTEACDKFAADLVLHNAQQRYQTYLTSVRQDFREKYIRQCLDVTESFTTHYTDKEHHRTLYYYDQAGNLTRTVPPEGVKLITDAAKLAQIKEDRANGTRSVFSEHTLATTYSYNSLNQPLTQDMPDHKQMDVKSIRTGFVPASGLTVTATQFKNSNDGIMIANDGVQTYFYTTNSGGTSWFDGYLGSANTLNDVQLITATSIVYAIGVEGTFLKSTNNGDKWIIRQTPTNANLYRLNFFSATEGIVFGTDGMIWRTVDGGESQNWTAISTLQSIMQGTLSDVRFSGTTGLAFSSLNGRGYAYKTIDSGTTWQPVSDFRALDFYSLYMLNAQRGFAGGIDGTLFKTANGGQTWQAVAADQTITFRDMHFFTDDHGLALDDAGTRINRTSSGGTQWISSTLPTGIYFTLFAKNASNLYIGGSNGSTPSIQKSIDGGNTWTASVTTGLPSGAVADLFYRNDNDAVVVTGTGGDVYTLAVDNTLVPPAPKWTLALDGDVRRLSFVDDQQGYALSGNAGVLKTIDGGKTWTSVITTIAAGITFKDISFADVSNGWATGLNGEIYKTTDGGLSWTSSQQILPLPVSEVTIVGTSAYAAGQNGRLWKSVDSGASWKMVNARIRKNFNTVAMFNANILVIGGDLGFIYRTFDGGTSWQAITAPRAAENFYTSAFRSASGYLGGTNSYVADYSGSNVAVNFSGNTLRSMDFRPGANVGFAVGDRGFMMFTLNGTRWFTSSFNVRPQVLYDVHLVTDQVAYAVGKEGAITKSSNGGGVWSSILTSNRQDLHGVYFVNANTGVAVGNGGTILRTTDGGTDKFSAVASGTVANLRAVHFTKDGSLGVVVGYGGTILTSANGGQNWTTQTSGTAANLHGLYIFDQNTIYAVGDNGTILKGTNNGTQWQKLTDQQGRDWLTANQRPTATLRDVYFRDFVTGYAVGDNGSALKTTNRGVTWELTDTRGQTGNILDIATVPNQPSTIVLSGTDRDVRLIDDQSDLFGTRFFYDEKGRLIISQNSRQFAKAIPAYSYTLYDALGRIAEVGEIASTTDPANFKGYGGEIRQYQFDNWITNGSRTEITRTWYDRPVFELPDFEQKNLRTRVASVTYQDVDGAAYDNATHYDYDIHGNVQALVQDVPALESVAGGQRYKRVDYEYDLVAGKINKVKYQEGKPDQFFNRYEYDADNRLTSVYTSTDGLVWDRDAAYIYYNHGPLARTELGENNIQGIDYVYTLQNWVKGVNSNALDPNADIGKDGTPASKFAKDEIGYSLGYYNGDYQAIGASPDINQTYNAKALYNGNISSMVSSIGKFIQEGITQASHYEYDQLNRIKKANTYNLTGGQLTAKNDYSEEYTYDANGNILTLKRNATGAQANTSNTGLDNLTYIYENQANGYKRNTNKLKAVLDSSVTPEALEDIKPGQQWDANTPSQDNYQYDEIGNLITDKQEGVLKIDWTSSGKVAKVERTDGSITEFDYDARGNRIAKKHSATNGTITTYYVRDASGNVVGIYENEASNFKLIEQPIYGSDRLGMRTDIMVLDESTIPNYNSYSLGFKRYELKNHLGNVVTSIADRKDVNGHAIVTSASDYYAFGMQAPGRNFNSISYRYGFNGKEKDDQGEFGSRTIYDYGARVYNPSIGKFLSIDPDADQYPQWSPYLFAGNNPVIYIDENGEGPEPLTTAGLKVLANSLGVFGNKRVGELFERIAIKAIQSQYIVVHNTTLNFESRVRAARNIGKPSAVRPDGIGLTKRVGGVADIQGDKNSFYEVKATTSVITRGYRKGQIEGMIDVLSTRMSKSKVKIATLTLLTTSDTKVSEEIKQYATKRGVTLYQSTAAIDENNNVYFSDPERLNDVPGKDHSIENFLQAIDLDKYDTFTPQNAKTHSQGLEKKITTPLGDLGNVNPDPDPAEVDDK